MVKNFRKIANNTNKQLMNDLIQTQKQEFDNLLLHIEEEASKGNYDLLITQTREGKVVERELKNLLEINVIVERRGNDTYMLRW